MRMRMSHRYPNRRREGLGRKQIITKRSLQPTAKLPGFGTTRWLEVEHLLLRFGLRLGF